MSPGFMCPICGKELETYEADARMLCDQCGDAIEKGAPRLLLVGRNSVHAFCSPDCLRSYETVDELYSKMGSRREE